MLAAQLEEKFRYSDMLHEFYMTRAGTLACLYPCYSHHQLAQHGSLWSVGHGFCKIDLK